MSKAFQGSARALTLLLAAEDRTLKLFTDDHQPVHGEAWSTYTEATGLGYGAPLLPKDGWTVTSGTPDVGTQPSHVFEFTGEGSINIYGWYIVDSEGQLVCSERDPDAPVSRSGGETYAVTPRITFGEAA